LILADVNVLLYAFRSDSEMHGVYRPWLLSVINGEEPFALSTQVLTSVIRIATNSRAFVKPDSLASVMAFAAALLEQPHCRVVHPGPLHWAIFRDLCQKANATANLVQDAWFAALAIEHGCERITEDRDYARFPGLRRRTLHQPSPGKR
jgi:toxin-antitoxin system PIN domain toxin